MFQTAKNKILFTTVLSLTAGLLSFFIFHFSKEVSIMSIFIVAVLSSVILASIEKSPDLPTEEKTDSADEQYRLLEKKFKAISEKADKLEHESKTTELFLASMSHEIRTPLNGIIGLTEILDDTVLSKEQKEFVSMIRESSNNLRVIVNDVLDVSKLNAGKMELESIAFDLFGKIDSYLEQARSIGKEKAVRAVASANGAN
ncbi:MAG TPA: hybrid sensor histidine kinase/response regulator, partial [Sulfurovum sp.]|nr:hybrid sensor histidine kinase/response regulator [Sulfurovum sp.]